MASFCGADLTSLKNANIYHEYTWEWCIGPDAGVLIIFPCCKQILKWINIVYHLQYNVNSIKPPHNDQQSFISTLYPSANPLCSDHTTFQRPFIINISDFHIGHTTRNVFRILHKFMSLIKLKFVMLYLLLQCAS